MIVAMDIATQTGVAFGGRKDEAPTSLSVDLGRGRSEDYRFSRILQLTHNLIEEHGPATIAIESAIGGPNASAYLIGLVACVRGVAANRHVPIKMCAIGSVRKHFLGRVPTRRDFPGMKPAQAKAAIKGLVMERCRVLGWQVADDNCADACALFDFARATMGAQTVPAGGLFDG